MKTIFSLVAACIFSVAAMAEHPVVMGVNLGTATPDEFISTLVAKGWQNDGEGILSNGKFAGYEDCTAFFIESAQTHKIAKVAVVLPEITTWKSIKRTYNNVLDVYISKYGEPNNNYHFFSSPYKEGDGYEMTAVKVEKCHYVAIWNRDGYNIMVEISKFNKVRITYEDEENFDLYKTERAAAASNDI